MAPPSGYLAARFGAVDDASIVATAGDRAARGAPSEGRSTAGLIDRRNCGRLVASGRDRASYLQGMLTNDVLALKPGQGCYACYLTPQGRMISDMWVFELGDLMLLTLPAATRATVLARLDQFIFSEDVQLGDVTETFASLAVAGPSAAAMLSEVLEGATPSALAVPEGGNFRASFQGEPAIVLRPGDLGVAGYEVLVDASMDVALRERLHGAGAVDVSADAADVLRVEGGIPLFGVDMDEDTIPLEAGIESRAISLTKGCYVGQEVIIRVLHRGHGRVARKLVGLSIEGPQVPVVDAPIQSGAELHDIGRVTSAVWSPVLRRVIALGYVHRDAATAGTQLLLAGAPAVVTALPFVA
jgi:folate-binding protein YgfZ